MEGKKKKFITKNINRRPRPKLTKLCVSATFHAYILIDSLYTTYKPAAFVSL